MKIYNVFYLHVTDSNNPLEFDGPPYQDSFLVGVFDSVEGAKAGASDWIMETHTKPGLPQEPDMEWKDLSVEEYEDAVSLHYQLGHLKGLVILESELNQASMDWAPFNDG